MNTKNNFHSRHFMTSTSNNIVSSPNYDIVTLFQNLAPSLPSKDLPYRLTLTFEDLLIPKIKNGGKIPRPLNSWLLFRKDYTAMIKKLQPENKNKFRIQDISSMASESWKKQPAQVKQFFEILGVTAKKAHRLIFPNYKFTPERKFKLRFDKVKSNSAPRIDLPSSPEDAQSEPSDSSFPSLEDIRSSLIDCENTSGEITLKEFFDLTISELNNTNQTR
ncbi:hypothetical protein RclHR1_05020012 [Rhizophagus clarus]|uniref:HMG box domain-containing protein n=1 Tax=Rhizophagus clarus TaxID=94130 RepID=A0A2Z6RXV1_9GLOM|nr:hypothetical protein RclHR1_05020012 [Rhizophagus clarus]GET04295.1 hypothetical protein RCL_jg24617.t1 [Rhizophagus clarus]